VNQATLGPSGGLGLNFPLYDAGLRSQQVETARLARESVQLSEADLLLQVELDMQNAWDRYQLALQQLQREQENLVLAEAVLDRTRELVDLGQLGQLDFRTAQLNLQRSLDVITNYRLQVRQAELELLHLAGLLVK
jgi:outer membrane protein TolC